MKKTTFLSRNFPSSITVTLLYEDGNEGELKDDAIKLEDFLKKLNRRKKFNGGLGIRFLVHSSVCPKFGMATDPKESEKSEIKHYVCKKCGKEWHYESAKYCTACGRKIERPQ